jgi:hypothetical protein
MPTTYAHVSFGDRVFDRLDDEIKELLTAHLSLFQIGLHGPDIFLYYMPLRPDPIKSIGRRMHKEPASRFLANGRIIQQESPYQDASTAYLLGFLCHFMLDSECHPLVREVESSHLLHNEIETEFDRALLLRDNKEPQTYRPTAHLIVDPEISRCISGFYDGASPEEVRDSIRSMRRYLNLFVAPRNPKRALLVGTLKLFGLYPRLHGMLMSKTPNPACAEINFRLLDAFDDVVAPTVEILQEFYRHRHDDSPLNSRLDRNFG